MIESYNALPPPTSPAWAATLNASLTANSTAALRNATSLNLVGSLHTAPGCNVVAPGRQAGVQESTTCDATQNGNEGCGVDLGSATRVRDWNAGGGGWYVLWRDFERCALPLLCRLARPVTDASALAFAVAVRSPSTLSLATRARSRLISSRRPRPSTHPPGPSPPPPTSPFLIAPSRPSARTRWSSTPVRVPP